MAKRSHGRRLQRSLTGDPPAIEVRIYAQDPKVARGSGVGLATIELKGEVWLGQGPTTSRFKVVDRDDTAKRTYPAARVLADGTGFDVGRGNPATNFKFHQVNAWATMSRLLEHLESPQVFGRRIPWAFPEGRLEIRPHAEIEENAWYDRSSRSIRFGYFDIEGSRPKARLYTCLSHDVIAHEFGHAVLDGLKPYYEENDSPDLGGFHEFFGDAVAMTSALTLRDPIARLLRRTRGKGKSRDSLKGLRWIFDVMEQWGTAYGDSYIRTAKNRVTMQKLRGNIEAHDRAAVLSGTAYDIFRGVYAKVCRHESDVVDAVIKAANYTSRMMLRAVDYCPPAGVDYGQYARAVIRADEVAYPVDGRGYRALAKKIFDKRGIRLARGRELNNDQLRAYDVEQLASSDTDAYIFLDRNREALGIPRNAEFRVATIYETRKTASGGYFPPREIVIEFVWSKEVPLRGSGFGPLEGTRFELWCGGTLVFDTSGNVLHYVLAEDDASRRRTLLTYLRKQVANGEFDEEDEDEGMEAVGRRRARAVVEPDGRLRIERVTAARCATRRRPKKR